MSTTRIICEGCGFPQAWCECEKEEAMMERLEKPDPVIKTLLDRVKELEEEISSLRLSGNPIDWKKASAQELVLMGHLEAVEILRKFLEDNKEN